MSCIGVVFCGSQFGNHCTRERLVIDEKKCASNLDKLLSSDLMGLGRIIRSHSRGKAVLPLHRIPVVY